jgi:two-component system response regulator DesR
VVPEPDTAARVTAGRPSPDIAATMSLSEGTVRNHLSATIKKVGSRNRPDAARLARDKGWLEPRA